MKSLKRDIEKLIKKLPTRANALAEICDGEPIFINADANNQVVIHDMSVDPAAPEIVIGSYNWYGIFKATMRKHALPNFNADPNQILLTLTKWHLKNIPSSVMSGSIDVQLTIASMPLTQAISLYTDYYKLDTFVNIDGVLTKKDVSNQDIQRCANTLNKEFSSLKISSFAVPSL